MYYPPTPSTNVLVSGNPLTKFLQKTETSPISINLLTSHVPWVQGGRRPIIEPYQYKDLNQSLSLGSRSMIVRFMKVLACLADI